MSKGRWADGAEENSPGREERKTISPYTLIRDREAKAVCRLVLKRNKWKGAPGWLSQ